MWRASADGQLEYVNKRVTDYTGESFEDAVHSGLITIHPEDRDLVVAASMRAIETSEHFGVAGSLPPTTSCARESLFTNVTR